MNRLCQVLVIVGCALSPCAFSQEIDAKGIARQQLPVKAAPYTYEELFTAIDPFLHKDVKVYFQNALQMMFTKFPPPRHPNSVIVTGWRCLLKKLILASAKESVVDDQKKALLDVLAIHKNLIKERDPSLYKDVNEVAPCEYCRKEAIHEYTARDEL